MYEYLGARGEPTTKAWLRGGRARCTGSLADRFPSLPSVTCGAPPTSRIRPSGPWLPDRQGFSATSKPKAVTVRCWYERQARPLRWADGKSRRPLNGHTLRSWPRPKWLLSVWQDDLTDTASLSGLTMDASGQPRAPSPFSPATIDLLVGNSRRCMTMRHTEPIDAEPSARAPRPGIRGSRSGEPVDRGLQLHTSTIHVRIKSPRHLFVGNPLMVYFTPARHLREPHLATARHSSYSSSTG